MRWTAIILCLALAGCDLVATEEPSGDVPIDAHPAEMEDSTSPGACHWEPPRTVERPSDAFWRPVNGGLEDYQCVIDRIDRGSCDEDWTYVPFSELAPGTWFTADPGHEYALMAIGDGRAVAVCYEPENGGDAAGLLPGDGVVRIGPDAEVVPLAVGDVYGRPAMDDYPGEQP